MSAGLQTHIWNNNIRSLVVLGLYPLIIFLIIWACTFVVNASFLRKSSQNIYNAYSSLPDPSSYAAQNFMPSVESANAILIAYWPAILTVIAIWFIIAFFFHTNMIRKLSHAHIITRKEEPKLYNLLENLCIAQGMTPPRLNIIETHARNAFASGINEATYTVTLTRGLINSLKKDELEAVIAHELTHIQNRDVRLLMITVIFTGMIGFAAQLLWSSIRYRLFYFSRGNNRNKGAALLVILALAAILWIGYIATLFMRFALSRSREYMADSGAVQMTKNPEAMMRALMRISGRDHIPEATQDIAMMCVENHKRFFGIFATHPPIESRIKVISEITNTPIPQLIHTGPAPKKERFISGN